MGVLVKIKAKQQENSVIYYTVLYTDFPEILPFKIAIDSVKKHIYIFKDLNIHDTAIKIIDMNNEDDPIGDCQIPFPIIGSIIKSVLKCFRENNFPEDISYRA